MNINKKEFIKLNKKFDEFSKKMKKTNHLKQ